VFADLAGYTAVTEAHGDEEAADLAANFYGHARELLARCEGEEVKLIGDELMARIHDPAAAIQFAIDLSHHSARRHELLAVRVGLHHGRCNAATTGSGPRSTSPLGWRAWRKPVRW